MAARGSIAPLSSNEEVTLRRVALGIAQPGDLSPRDLAHLKKLDLVELDGESPSLTALGRRRYSELPRSVPIADLQTEADFAGLLAKHIGDPARRR